MTVVEPGAVVADAVGWGQGLLDEADCRVIDDITDRLLTWMRSATTTDGRSYRAAS